MEHSKECLEGIDKQHKEFKQNRETINMQITVFVDKEFPKDWHVEAIDTKSGDIFQAVFAGPDAEDRAREYADWQRSKQLVAEAA